MVLDCVILTIVVFDMSDGWMISILTKKLYKNNNIGKEAESTSQASDNTTRLKRVHGHA